MLRFNRNDRSIKSMITSTTLSKDWTQYNNFTYCNERHCGQRVVSEWSSYKGNLMSF